MLLKTLAISLPVFLFAQYSKSEVDAGTPINAEVWRSEIGESRSLLLERAYIYGAVFYHYQYAFILETTLADRKSRRLLWVRHGYPSTISGRIPEPQIELLDARFAQDTLYVVFNQYEKCWAFALDVSDASKLAIPQPTHPDLDGTLNWAAVKISVDAKAKAAKISDGDGKTVKARVVLTDTKDAEKRFDLTKARDGQWVWSTDPVGGE